MKSLEYLNEIRKASGLKRAVLQKITVEGREVVFYLFTDVSYSADDVSYADGVSLKYVPEGYTARVRVLKSVPSAEGVRRALADTLKSKFPAVAAFVTPEDIGVFVEAGGGRFAIAVDGGDKSRVSADDVLDTLQRTLSRSFCGVWSGEFRVTEKEKGAIDFVPEPEEYELTARYFKITDYAAIDGAAPKDAIYVADLTKEAHGVTVCGTVSHIEERVTKNNRPYFLITLSDGSGQMRASYFSKKATLEKIRSLAAGAQVCITGDNEFYNGGLSFRGSHVDFGAPPKGFVPKERPSRPVPATYKKVVPVPVSDLVQGGMFDESRIPDSLKEGKFVVFDLETTGLSEGGVMDRIIEVGAVKILDGKICEKFSTFVACPVKLSAKIIELTGITDDMLVGAPDIKDVIADFYKFCYGHTIVAHNAQFDCKFIRYYGDAEGYSFDMKQMDTLALAQETLRLSNYKLNTIADYFGFQFNHHRAFDDAFVTAKIFIELMKLRGGRSAR